MKKTFNENLNLLLTEYPVRGHVFLFFAIFGCNILAYVFVIYKDMDAVDIVIKAAYLAGFLTFIRLWNTLDIKKQAARNQSE